MWRGPGIKSSRIRPLSANRIHSRSITLLKKGRRRRRAKKGRRTSWRRSRK